MGKPYGVVHRSDGPPIITYEKEYFLKRAAGQVQPMDIIGTLGGVKLWNPLSWFGRWVQSQTAAQIGHVEAVGEWDAIKDAPTIYTTGFRFKQIDFEKELKGQKRIMIKRMPGLSQGQRQQGLDTMRGFLGKRYPILDPLMLKVQSWLDPSGYRLMMDDPDPICSQSVAIAYEEMGVPISPGLGKHWSRMTPIDVISDSRLAVVAYWNWPTDEGVILK